MLIIFVFNIWNWGHLIDNISPHFIIVFSTHVFHKKKYLKYECNTELGNFLFVILVFLSIVCTMFTCFLLVYTNEEAATLYFFVNVYKRLLKHGLNKNKYTNWSRFGEWFIIFNIQTKMCLFHKKCIPVHFITGLIISRCCSID